MRCPVLKYATALRSWYAMSGTDVRYCPTALARAVGGCQLRGHDCGHVWVRGWMCGDGRMRVGRCAYVHTARGEWKH
eukprot:444324-Rhodomonas_salina.1